MTREYPHSIKALEEYDKGVIQRDLRWQKVETNAEIERLHAEDSVAKNRVREAFHQDTQDINSLEDCLRIDPEDIRRIALGLPRS